MKAMPSWCLDDSNPFALFSTSILLHGLIPSQSDVASPVSESLHPVAGVAVEVVAVAVVLWSGSSCLCVAVLGLLTVRTAVPCFFAYCCWSAGNNRIHTPRGGAFKAREEGGG
ncbi:hypothetical protein NQZ68_008634 [Dissostichus eleginoides]|nr:hypothetical protein NQZ68_008634 [Dissostichus eleginoides]